MLRRPGERLGPGQLLVLDAQHMHCECAAIRVAPPTQVGSSGWLPICGCRDRSPVSRSALAQALENRRRDRLPPVKPRQERRHAAPRVLAQQVDHGSSVGALAGVHKTLKYHPLLVARIRWPTHSRRPDGRWRCRVVRARCSVVHRRYAGSRSSAVSAADQPARVHQLLVFNLDGIHGAGLEFLSPGLIPTRFAQRKSAHVMPSAWPGGHCGAGDVQAVGRSLGRRHDASPVALAV